MLTRALSQLAEQEAENSGSPKKQTYLRQYDTAQARIERYG